MKPIRYDLEDVAEPWEDSGWMALVEREYGEYVKWDDVKNLLISLPVTEPDTRNGLTLADCDRLAGEGCLVFANAFKAGCYHECHNGLLRDEILDLRRNHPERLEYNGRHEGWVQIWTTVLLTESMILRDWRADRYRLKAEPAEQPDRVHICGDPNDPCDYDCMAPNSDEQPERVPWSAEDLLESGLQYRIRDALGECLFLLMGMKDPTTPDTAHKLQAQCVTAYRNNSVFYRAVQMTTNMVVQEIINAWKPCSKEVDTEYFKIAEKRINENI